MKRRLGFLALLGITFFSLTVAFTATIAWFSSRGFDFTSDRVTGKSQGAYFAYGTGTKDDPYGITNTRHLNNLAWLQYMGNFNNKNYDGDEDNISDRFYFELAANINEGGDVYVIPPIGTEKNPFTGVFRSKEGEHYTINNIKISNVESAFTNKPAAISFADDTSEDVPEYAKDKAEVVGFFGYVGDKANDDYEANTSPSISDFTLKNITIESRTPQTLAGLAAGYLDASISNVNIDGTATIDVNREGKTKVKTIPGVKNISDYALVGYTNRKGENEDDEGTYSQDLSEYYNSDESTDEGAGEGGSIKVRDYNQWFYELSLNKLLHKNGGASGTAINSSSSTDIYSYGVSGNYNVSFTTSSPGSAESDYFFSYTYQPDYAVSLFNEGKKGTLVYKGGVGYFIWEKSGTTYTLTFKDSTYTNNTTFVINSVSYSKIYLVNSSGNTYYLCKTTSSSNRAISNALTYNVALLYRFKEGGYLPLKFSTNENDSHAGTHSKNTGYIVGSNIGTAANASPKMAGYPISNISNSYSGATISDSNVDILTYNTVERKEGNTVITAANTWYRIKDSHNNGNAGALSNYTYKTPKELGFEKYEGYDSIIETEDKPLSRNSLKSMLSGSLINGIHFDSNKVSSSDANLFTIPTAKLNVGGEAKTYTNFKVPKGSIDFHFPSNGFINFFAGTYNTATAVRCNFFSLYSIDRNTSTGAITGINEIVEVYNNLSTATNASKYIYKYSDGKYSDTGTTTKSSNVGSLIFDVDAALRMKNQTAQTINGVSNCKVAPEHNALYYFEIPVNKGEYAMGLVSNGVTDTKAVQGAYLIYLDIGANAEVTQKGLLDAYSITTNIGGATSLFPSGVDFIPINVGGDGGETICVAIAGSDQGIKGVLTFVISSQNINITNNDGIGATSYLNNDNYAESSATEGKFTCNLPGAPPSGTVNTSERVLTITVTPPGDNQKTKTISIIDQLEVGTDTVVSSEYYIDYGNGAGYVEITQNAVSTINSLLGDYGKNIYDNTESTEIYKNSLRNLTKAATLTRKSGSTGQFSTSYNKSGCDCANKTIAINLDKNGAEVSISVTTGYKVIIGSDTYDSTTPTDVL